MAVGLVGFGRKNATRIDLRVLYASLSNYSVMDMATSLHGWIPGRYKESRVCY
jgi:hypothetical protein